MNENIEGFKLEYVAHPPQNGSGVIICRAKSVNTLLSIFNMWRKNFNISFDIKPALTNEELASVHNEDDFWAKD